MSTSNVEKSMCGSPWRSATARASLSAVSTPLFTSTSPVSSPLRRASSIAASTTSCFAKPRSVMTSPIRRSGRCGPLGCVTPARRLATNSRRASEAGGGTLPSARACGGRLFGCTEGMGHRIDRSAREDEFWSCSCGRAHDVSREALHDSRHSERDPMVRVALRNQRVVVPPMPIKLPTKRAANSGVGLYVGTSHVAAVAASRKRVIAARSIELEPDVVLEDRIGNPEALSEALREVTSGGAFGRQVYLGLGAQHGIVRVLEMPLIEDAKERDTAVRYHAAEAIAMPLDD